MIIRASMLERMQLCPGSRRAAADLFSPDSAASTSGRLVHEALALIWRKGQPLYQKVEEVCDQLKLTDRQRYVAGWFTARLNQELERMGGAMETWCEVPLRKDNVVGTCDLLIHTNRDDWLCIDWKTGDLSVKTASENIQLGAYCAMGRERFGYSRVTGYLFSAGNMRDERFSSTSYNGAQMESLWLTIREVIAATEMPDAELRPTLEACRYCPALGNAERCRPSIEHGLAVVEGEKSALLDVKRDGYQRRLTPIQAKALTDIFDQIAYAKKLEKAVSMEIYKRMSEGEEIPGFRLTQPSERRNVTDPERAYQEIVVNRKLSTHEDFMKQITMTGAGVQRACRKAMTMRGIKSKDMRQFINGVMTEANILETKETKPRLQRIGYEEDQIDE